MATVAAMRIQMRVRMKVNASAHVGMNRIVDSYFGRMCRSARGLIAGQNPWRQYIRMGRMGIYCTAKKLASKERS